MSAVAFKDNSGYIRLIKRFPLAPIRNEKHLDAALVMVDELLERKNLSADEKDYFDILVDQVKHFEKKIYPTPKMPTVELLKYLMDRNGLRSVDLVPSFGNKSVVSAVLNGNRQLSKSHIAKLAKRFNLSPAVFFPDEA